MKFSVGTEYRFPTAVRHQGMVIVLALDEKREIYYRVLALDPAQPDDDKSWSDRRKLSFPDEIRPAGMSLVTVGLKTAERTADAPFQAVSDGKHVYLFRQSTDGTLYVDRFVFDPAPQKLNPAWEARFQRSRKRDLPASRKDTLGARDMESEPFFEPTTELTVVKGLQDGRFCALLLPGRLPSQWRWQIFATNSEGEIPFPSGAARTACLTWPTCSGPVSSGRTLGGGSRQGRPRCCTCSRNKPRMNMAGHSGSSAGRGSCWRRRSAPHGTRWSLTEWTIT
jgi:hypothetical protein